MYKKNTGGYMTVEASLLMPALTIGIVFLILLGFYLYNISCIRQIAYVAALRGASLKDLGWDEIERDTKEQLVSLLDNRLIMVQEKDYQVNISLSKVKVTIEGYMEMPFLSYLSDILGLWKMKAEGEAIRDNPVEIIRGARK